MNAKEIYAYLVSSGLTPAGACGLMGNLYAESGLKFNVLERLCIQRYKERGIVYTDESYTTAVDSGAITRAEFLNPMGKKYGYGICQWTSEGRKAGLYDGAKIEGVSIGDPELQMEYLVCELKTNYQSVRKVLTTTNSVREASDIVLKRFESPADQSEAVKTYRASIGQEYYNQFVNVSKGGDNVGTLQGLISRGLAEDGYIEKASAQHLDEKTVNKGTANYTKYARDINSWGLMGCQAQAWCCSFQFWLEAMEFGVEKALEHWNMTKSTYVGYNCFSTYNAFAKAGKVGKEPRLGAIPIFTFSHAGRVVKIYKQNGKQVWDCLEGNTSSNLNDRNGGQVCIKTRPWNDATVKGFCYINYDEEVAPEPEPVKEGFKMAADGKRWWYQYADGTYPAGKFAFLREATGGTYGWYLFDAEGYMLTGHQTALDGRQYYLCEEPGIHEGKCMVTDDQGALQIADWDKEKNRYAI